MLKSETLESDMTDTALEHIRKVNETPDIEMTDVDPYDAWIPFGDDWELNVSEANFGFKYDTEEAESDSSKFIWYACAYEVELSEDKFFRVNTDKCYTLFKYENKGNITFVTKQ